MLTRKIEKVYLLSGFQNVWEEARSLLGGVSLICFDSISFESDSNTGIKTEILDRILSLGREVDIFFGKVARFEGSSLKTNDFKTFEFRSESTEERIEEVLESLDDLNDSWSDPQYDEFKEKLKFIVDLIKQVAQEDENE